LFVFQIVSFIFLHEQIQYRSNTLQTMLYLLYKFIQNYSQNLFFSIVQKSKSIKVFKEMLNEIKTIDFDSRENVKH
jgi:hypothetical protein